MSGPRHSDTLQQLTVSAVHRNTQYLLDTLDTLDSRGQLGQEETFGKKKCKTSDPIHWN